MVKTMLDDIENKFLDNIRDNQSKIDALNHMLGNTKKDGLSYYRREKKVEESRYNQGEKDGGWARNKRSQGLD